MTSSEPAPFSDEPPTNRQRIGMLIKRDLPDRAGASEWCGKHPKDRTRLIARARWVCLDCLRETAQQ
ncbi:hypothetical protein [Streptomyces catenulae]|uniref:Uncharacterized protein n=1 Tax=Streptomyces catenulae TaxID=66875 RepID=A0ABV2Z8M8_9ACTN|nr:hypothetical protein [Streptomyces catenulae]